MSNLAHIGGIHGNINDGLTLQQVRKNAHNFNKDTDLQYCCHIGRSTCILFCRTNKMDTEIPSEDRTIAVQL